MTAPVDLFVPHRGAVIDDRFELISLLATTASHHLWFATDQQTGQLAVVKCLTPETMDVLWLQTGLAREAVVATAMASTGNPHLMTAPTLVAHDTVAVLDYVEGPSLDVVTAQRGLLPVSEVQEILFQLAHALRTLHDYGFVHRDIKPSNIMWNDVSRHLTLIDYGVANIIGSVSDGIVSLGERVGLDMNATYSQGSHTAGSPQYMSPEAYQGLGCNGASDMFSTGIVLSELLVGERPFDGPSSQATAERIINAEPPDLLAVRPDLPPAIGQLTNRLLAKDPTARYDPQDLMSALSDI